MTIEELRNKLNAIIDKGYGNLSCIGERYIKYYEGPDGGYNPEYEWRFLKDVQICDRDGHGGAGLNLIMEE